MINDSYLRKMIEKQGVVVVLISCLMVNDSYLRKMIEKQGAVNSITEITSSLVRKMGLILYSCATINILSYDE